MKVSNLNNDSELLKEISKGNTMAFELYYLRHKNNLLKFILYITKNNHFSEDILHEVFEEIIEKSKQLNEQKNSTAWLFTIAANKSKNYLRNMASRSKINEALFFETADEPKINEEQGVLKNLILNAVEELSEKEKLLHHLKFEKGYSLQEISSILDLPIGSVKSGLFYLLKKLSVKLKGLKNEYR